MATIRAMSILLPVNIVFISFMRETGLSLASIGPAALLAFVESAGVFVLGRNEQGIQASQAHIHHAAATLLPSYSFYTFAVAGIFLIVRFLITRPATDSALFWSFSALVLFSMKLGPPMLPPCFLQRRRVSSMSRSLKLPTFLPITTN